ncbi:MAG: hypothetical protein ACR2G2_06455 [Pseudonocardia sp.]
MLDRVRAQLTGATGSAGCLALGTMCDPVNRRAETDALTSRHVDRMRAAIRTAVDRAAAAGNPAAAVELLDGLRSLLPPATESPG